VYRAKKLQIFSGTANLALTTEIAEHIGISLGKAEIKRFSDGEVSIYIGESVRGANVFIVQPICYPANENLMELLIMMDAMKRASAKSINAVLPYYGYARQDRKTRARDPITAKLVADLLTTAGADRVITMDLHAGQIQGFFDIPVDHLKSLPILSNYFLGKNLIDAVVVSPDMGGVTRARELAERLKLPIAIIDKRRPEPNVAEVMHVIGNKRRPEPNVAEVMHIIGNVEGKTVIMIDDIIDTAGTISLGAQALLEHGAKDVYACCTHPVLSGEAIKRLEESPIKEIVVTNTIPQKLEGTKIKVLSVAPLIGDAIIRIHEELSVSKLFD